MNAKRLSTSSYVDGKREDETISLQLNGNRLVMNDTGNWVFKSTDLDNATYEIEKLVSEKLMLIQSLTKIMKQAEDLQKEVVESNEIKTGVLELVHLLLSLFFSPSLSDSPLISLVVDGRAPEASCAGN